jgi:hypothetical protein
MDPAVQRWHLRRERRAVGIARVHDLAARGLSARAIGRNTVRRWLASAVDAADRALPPPATAAGKRQQRHRQTPALLAQIHALAAAGATHMAIAQMTGVHRVTVAHWLSHTLAPPHAAVAPQEPPTAATTTLHRPTSSIEPRAHVSCSSQLGGRHMAGTILKARECSCR